MAWTRLYQEAEPQRVNRWLAQSGVCSRREAEALIGRGLVSIDGERVEDPGRKIAAGQTLVLADAAEAGLQAAMTVVLHKPVGVVSANPEEDQVEAAQLLAAEPAQDGTPPPEGRLSPVGRLDRDSRGLLLLSNDGVVAKAVIGPDAATDKEYRVRVAGEITPQTLARLRHGLHLDGRRLKPADVELIGRQRLRIVLREGRNRQIRRMAELVGLEVIDLLRTRVGPVSLGALPEGGWRRLTAEERAALLRGSAPPPPTQRR